MTTDTAVLSKTKTCPSCGSTTKHRKNRSLYCTACYDARYSQTPCPLCDGPMKIGSAQCAKCRFGVRQPKQMTPEQIAWVAGILEGEGSFVKRPHDRAGRVQVVMTAWPASLRRRRGAP